MTARRILERGDDERLQPVLRAAEAPRAAKVPYGLLAASGALWFGTALLRRGRLHADEIFQYLEPAHRLAFGRGVVSWEWVQGLRNWFVPALFSAPLRATAWLGIDDPRLYTALIWALCAGVQVLGALALFRLVEERDGERAARLALWVYGTWGAFAVFAARTLGDSLSVVPMLGALLMVWRARVRGRAWAGFAGGVLIGLAFVVRYPSAVFGLPLAVSLIVARRWRALAAFVVGGGLVVAALAGIDYATWGSLSAWNYFRFNVVEGGASKNWGSEPWWWYLPMLAALVPQLLAYPFARGLRRADVVVGAFATYFASIEVLAHKELRFLVPLVPLFVVIAAGPAVEATSRLRGRAVLRVLVALHAAVSIAYVVAIPIPQQRDLLDAYVAVGREHGLTGLLLVGTGWWSSGGYYYLHRDVPLYSVDGKEPDADAQALADPRYSHVIVFRERMADDELRRAGFTPSRKVGSTAVWSRPAR